EYGQSFRTSLAKDLARHGLKMVATEPVKPGDTDVRAQVAKLQGAKPEVTFLVLVPGPAVQALRERQKIGWTETLMVSVGPLITALEGIRGFESGILPPLTIGPGHETQKQGFWVRIEQGRFKPLTDWLKSE